MNTVIILGFIKNSAFTFSTVVSIILILFALSAIKIIFIKFKTKTERIFYSSAFIILVYPFIIFMVSSYFINIYVNLFLDSMKKDDIEYFAINKQKLDKNKMMELFGKREWVHGSSKKEIRGSVITIKFKDDSQKEFDIRYNLNEKLIYLRYSKGVNIYLPGFYNYLKETKIDFTRLNE